MSWYNSSWSYRLPVSIDNSASTLTTIDVGGAFPVDLYHLWNNSQTDGDDIILTEADGITQISAANGNCTGWDLNSGGTFNGATFTGGIQIDGWTGATANQINIIWLYYGNNAATNTRDGTVSLSGAKTYALAKADVRSLTPKWGSFPENAGATTPRISIPKTTNETIDVYIDFRAELARRRFPYQTRLLYEEIKSIDLSCATASVVDETAVQLVSDSVVKARVTAGSDATDYTPILKVTTTLGRVLDRRFILKVNDATG